MRLFIAEKPSVGREISKYLGGTPKRGDGFIDHGNDVVTWAFGHVLEQAEPGDYDERYQRWRAEDLPIVPTAWKLLVTKSSAKQFRIITGLMKKADVIVNAGDPDREGQLLIDEILEYTGNTKPVQRILLNALDEKSVRAALSDLRDNKDFFNLKQSALARSRADWLIGMNLSRAYTLAQRRKGNKVTFPIGRVKTPTLALVVRRERELENFKPVDYYLLKVLYAHPKGSFWSTWKPKDEQVGLDADGHVIKQEVALELAKRVAADTTGVISSCSRSKKKEAPRLPLSLSALQVAAGKAYGYDPQQVLDTAQKLYEKKLTTYPRSDCDYLPENQYGDRTAILQHLAAYGDATLSAWVQGANPSIKTRAWNDKKITAHHAIIPTTVKANKDSLTAMERNIYFLIARSYIAQFYGDHIYEQTKITVTQVGEEFVASGHVVLDMGWKELFQRTTKKIAKSGEKETTGDQDTGDGRSDDDDTHEGRGESHELPRVKKGDTVTVENTAIDKKQTKPPTRFTSSTLLQAMKEIHKYVRNDELKKQLKAVSGIGTEATRATIIGELISRKFMRESGKKKVLQPTELGYMLVDALPDEMLYPDETAIWEERLADMSDGKGTLDAFLRNQVQFLTRLINKANEGINVAGSTMPGGYGVPMETTTRTIERNTMTTDRQGSHREEQPHSDIPCPRCGTGHLVRRQGKFGTFFGCSDFPKCRYTAGVGDDGMPRDNDGTGGTNTTFDWQPNDAQLADAKAKGYVCPRCKTGYFVSAGEGTRKRWICSNTEHCRTTCADVNGVPSVYVGKK